MIDSTTPNIPIELMELLNAISRDIGEVKERIIRIEAQDHSDSIRTLRQEIKEERDKRVILEIELANVKTKLAPIIIGLSVMGAGIVDIVGRLILK